MDPYMLVLGLFFLVCSCVVLLRWNKVKYRRKGLPPGTMGWPLFGETIEFLRQGPNFTKDRRARYGSFYKTHFLGSPTVISMDPDLNRYILLNESKGLFPGYPQSMLDILGKCNIAAVRGATHRYMRGAMLALISPTLIKEQLLPKIDELMRTQLKTWEDQVIDIQAKTKELLLLSSLRQVAGIESRAIAHKFQLEFTKLFRGVLSLPINLPGTNYWHGLQARKNIIGMLSQLLEERRASGETHEDMLDGLMRIDDTKYKLSDEEIIDQVITLLYSGFETVSTTSMMALKYLYEHPKALEELRNEHLEIRARKRPEDPIEWDDLKSMRFTRAVVIETARLATIVHGVMRRTAEDIELNGYVIPKGWRIYVYTREINYDPIMYPDPLAFNPWRWLDKSLESHNYFFLFGRGTRLCPGKELGVVEISAFLHYFVTRYRWEEIGGEKLMTFPRTNAPKGLRIKVSPY